MTVQLGIHFDAAVIDALLANFEDFEKLPTAIATANPVSMSGYHAPRRPIEPKHFTRKKISRPLLGF
jgi:hypothetical protein